MAFGKQVREARMRSRMSLEDVSGMSGLSVSMISRIERGKSSPSVRSLLALSNALEISLGTLFDEDGPEEQSGAIIVRADNRPALDFGERRLVKELLSPQPIGVLELLMITLGPGGSTGPGTFSHDGEEGGLVLTGTMELVVGEVTYTLSEGDSFTFKSTTPHSYRNKGDSELKVLWVNTPPVY